MWARQWTLQEAAGDAGAGGSGSAAGAADAAGSAGGSSAAPAQGTAAPASALAAGASAQPAAGGQASDWIPEKFRVAGDDGALNLEASAKKLAESYDALARRIGTGELPPKSAEEYKVEKLPEGAPAWDEFKTAPENASFLKAAHAKGMTNAQLEFVLGQFYERAPQLVAGAQALDSEAATTALREVWKEQPAFEANMRAAFKAAQAAAQRAGVPFAELEAAIGNNPVALRALAALGADLGEGQSAPAGANAQAGASVETLMASEAYWNEKHPEHARVSKQVRDFYNAKFPGKSL